MPKRAQVQRVVLFELTRLSVAADAALTGAVQSGSFIYISVITVSEVRYLVEKYKLPATVWNDLLVALADPAVPVESLAVGRAVQRIARSIVPDLPDRILAATALVHNLPLVTADTKIQSAPITTIW